MTVPSPGKRTGRPGTQIIVSRTTGRAVTDGTPRVDVAFIWLTA
jgi:hypothetical protein